MTQEELGQELMMLPAGATLDIEDETLGMLFPPGAAAGVLDDNTRTAAEQFAEDWGCAFAYRHVEGELRAVFSKPK